MLKKLINQLEKLISKKDTVNAKIQELANKLIAIVEKEEKQIVKAKEILARVANM